MLIDAGADVNQHVVYNKQYLFSSVAGGYTALALGARGLGTTANDPTIEESRQVVERLLAATGIDVNKKLVDGTHGTIYTALSYFQLWGNDDPASGTVDEEIVSMLKAAGGKTPTELGW